MPQDTTESGKSSARVLAGQKNWLLRGPLTEQGRQRLREAALRNEPWRSSTGPRTHDGKATAALNGHCHRSDPSSQRQLRAAVAEISGLADQLKAARWLLVETKRNGTSP